MKACLDAVSDADEVTPPGTSRTPSLKLRLLGSPALQRAGGSSTADSGTCASRPRRVLGRLGEPRGSAPGYRRPALIVSIDGCNRSRIRTVNVAAVMTDERAAAAPDDVTLVVGTAGRDRDRTVNVSQLCR